MVRWSLPFCLMVLFLPLLASCSESEEEDEEYANWQSRNEAYFEQQYQAHSVQSETSFIIPNWSQPSSLSLSDIAHTNCVLVDVLTKGKGTTCPQYTDSVAVHYVGHLMPTKSWPEGYEFDRSFLTELDPDVDVPSRLALNGSIISGFSTALQHMHRGDFWRVYVPYNLGYGSTRSGVILPYSTLVFDVYLVDFWSKEEGDRD